MVCSHLRVLLEIRVGSKHIVLLLEIVVHELSGIQTENYEKRTE